jgi:hypothetical protein
VSLSIDAIAPEVVGRVRLLPIVHERVDLAALIHAGLELIDPAVVALELPTTLQQAAERAVGRLPKITVVISEETAEDALVWVVAPGDPLVEALRWANERQRPVVLVDPDVRYLYRHHDPLPDPFVIWQLGADAYVDMVRQLAGSGAVEPLDTLREKGMAYHLQQAREETDGTILCLLGAAHVNRVAEHLQGPQAPPLARRRRTAVNLFHLHPDSLTALLPDPPLSHAVYEQIRNQELPAQTDFSATVSRRIELVREGLRLITGETADDAGERRRAMVAYAAHHATRQGPHDSLVIDRGKLGSVIWKIASASYQEQTREQTSRWQRRLFFDFARRYTRLKGQLIPSTYEWVMAGRGVADDNLAWEVFDCLRCYPWQEEQADLPTAKIEGEMLNLGTRKIRFRRRFFRVKQKPILVPVTKRRQPDDPSQWLQGFNGEGICSYPPEDLVVEDYGHFLQQKAISVIAAERSRSEPFTTSMLDGIDIRETMHKWHEHRIYVREMGRAPAAAGSVVVIFDSDPDGAEFPYLMTWLGEHEQESDMALYATDPGQQIVGPGIMRATYGGFMLTYPPGRLYDVWRDPDYQEAVDKPEVLVMAAVDYSQEKTVVHVAKSPPGPRLHQFAAQQGKRIIHIPIGSLSPIVLRKIRVLHILAGRDKRPIAKHYIW